MWPSENSFPAFGFSHVKNIFVAKTTKIWSQTHKTPIKNAYRSAQNSKNILGGGPPPQIPLTRGRIIPPSCAHPLSCLRHSIRRRTTFKYAATALYKQTV